MNMIKELFLILKYIFRRVLDDFIHFFLIHVFFFKRYIYVYYLYKIRLLLAWHVNQFKTKIAECYFNNICLIFTAQTKMLQSNIIIKIYIIFRIFQKDARYHLDCII